MEKFYRIPGRQLIRWTLSLLLTLGVSLPLMAQHKVSGLVNDQNGESVIGANVMVKGTAKGVTTDIEGKFNLVLEDPESILTITFVGFKPLEIPVQGRDYLDITLEDDIQELEELVVIGYGVQKKRVVTGAIASIDAEDIKKAPAVRADQLLQGRAAGVQVTTNTGQPGSGLTIRVRGNGTVNNGTPLYVVDGIPVGNINFINPSDIESFEVLKDAASAAIYGARGANGVVLVTTKSGSEGKLKLNYNTHYGIQNPWRKIAVLDSREYVTLRNEAAANSGKAMPFPDVNYDELGEGTDWQDALINNNAPMVRHNFEIAGGNEVTTLSSSFGYTGQEGIVGGDKSQYERYNFRLNATQKISDFIDLTSQVNYIRSKQRAIDPNSEFNSPIMHAMNMDPLTPVYETDSAVYSLYPNLAVQNQDGEYYGISNQVGQEIVNPLARIQTLHGLTQSDHIIGSATANVTLAEGLKFRSMASANLYRQRDNSFNPMYRLNGQQANLRSSVSVSNSTAMQINLENVLTYDKKFGSHNLGLMAGTTAQTERYDYMGGAKNDLATNDPEMAYISMATSEDDMISWGGANHSSLLSFFGRASYNYAEKYMLQAIMRADGSSKFGPNNRWGYFPSVSAGWVISEESFLKNNDVLSFLKLRASWGNNGNDRIGLYQYTSVIGMGYGYTFGYGEDSRFVNGAAPVNVSNPDLQWEASTQLNFAADARFLNDQLGLSLDLYEKTTSKMLLPGTIPAHVGNNPPTLNIGSVRNRGVEIDLNYRDKEGEFTYETGFNLALNQNEITAINNESGVFNGAAVHTFDIVSRSIEGQPIGYFYGYETDGVFQNASEIEAYTDEEGKVIQPDAQPGDLRFVDVNNDGMIDVEDRTNIGNPTPDVTLGFRFSAAYKGFDFNMFINGAYGQQIMKIYRRNDLFGANMPAAYLDRWHGEGTSNELPRLTEGDLNGNWSKMSDIYVEDGSFTRLKNIQLGYTFQPKAGNLLGLRSARVYVMAENLFTFTKYTGLDPEVGMNGSTQNMGIDRGSYPQPRTFLVGANISF